MGRHLKRKRRIYAQRRQLFREIVAERLRDKITLSLGEPASRWWGISRRASTTCRSVKPRR